MPVRVAAPRVERNWIAAGVDPLSVFHKDEEVHEFNPKKTSLAWLLVVSGAFKSFRQAYLAGFTGEVVVGWTSEVINGVGVYIYNPGTQWQTSTPWDEYDDWNEQNNKLIH